MGKYDNLEADYVDPEDYRTELKQFFQALQCRNDGRKLTELFEREELSVEQAMDILKISGEMRTTLKALQQGK